MKKSVVVAMLILFCALLYGTVAGAGPILNGILKKGELVVGITGDQPPLNATTKDGKVIGLDADLAEAIALNMGVKIRFAKMPFSELLPALQAGKVDMIISGMTMTPERNVKVAFIGPYLVSGKGVLTKSSSVALLDKEGVNSNQLNLAALKGSTSQVVVEQAAPKAKLVPAVSYDEALNLLFADKVNAIIADYPYCAYVATRYADKDLAVGQAKLTYEPLGIAVREDILLINMLENFIKLMSASGDMKIMQDKWFKNAAWMKQLP